MTDKIISQARLKELLEYNADTGVFIWVSARGGRLQGSTAGYNDTRGYVKISADGAKHWAHRLVWLYMFGKWPKYNIDHIDRNPRNNALSNLRDIPQSFNSFNCGIKKNNTSGYAGVSKDARRNKWAAYIMVNRKKISCGYHTNLDDAVKARKIAEKKHFKDAV